MKRRNYAGSNFSQFSNGEGVIRLQPGARATISLSTFLMVSVAADKPEAVAAGRIMSLHAGPRNVGAAAWFQDCEFGGSESAAGVPGEVDVENSACWVYSYKGRPSVWDRKLGQHVSAWSLTLDTNPADETRQKNVFADAENSIESAFLRPTDKRFQRILREESMTTRLEKVDVKKLPEGTDYITSNPYVGIDGVSPRTDVAADIVGLGGGGLLCVLAVLLGGWYIYFYKRMKDDSRSTVPSLVPPASIITSTLATNSQWETDNSATFMGTVCPPDVPPPEPDAPVGKKLHFLHTQLNGVAKDAVILQQFTLIGPHQRRQGGVPPYCCC